MAGVPAPEINYEFAGLMITFQARTGENGKISPETTPKTSGKILKLMKSNRGITIPELALEIGVTERSIERNIQNLQKEGRFFHINRTGILSRLCRGMPP